MQQQQQLFRSGLSQPAYLILASLVHGQKNTVELREAIEQAEGVFIEPGTLYRTLVQLDRRGWIEALESKGPLHPYHITDLGISALQSKANSYREQQQKKGDSAMRKGKETLMRLVLWMLCLYPPAWRERYKTEMVALLEQHEITLWTVLDLLVGALDARLDPHARRTRQLLPLRRFQTSWRLVVGGLVAFWIALLPWLWMSVLGISPDGVQCSNWGNDYPLCMMRVTVGMHGPAVAQTLLGMILGFLPILLIVFMVILIQARGRKARTHLLLTLPVTIGMLVLCVACGAWLLALWPLLPQISQFYPQAPAALLVGLIGMGLATVFALVALARAAFELRALSAASPKQESRPFSQNQQESEPVQGTDMPHLERPTVSASTSRGSSVPKGWIVVLVVLVLLFILPWPALVSSDSPDFGTLLVTWFLAGVVGSITALLVYIRSRRPRFWKALKVWGSVVPVALYLLLSMLFHFGFFFGFFFGFLLLACWVSIILAPFVRGRSSNAQADRATQKPRRDLFLMVWAILLPILFFLLLQPWERPMRLFIWLLISAICITSALVVKIHKRDQQADRTAQKPRNSMSPEVWIMVLPVLFLVCCMQLEFIISPDYNSFGDVLIAWLLTGLASLIILLVMKLGSRESTDLPTQEALQFEL